MKKYLPLLIVIVLSWFAVRNLIVPGYFSMHDDLQAMRQLQMHKCFQDRQIPCRWVPDMGYEYGYPLFNYYPPMPYYLGEVFVLLGISFLDTVKIVALLGFLVAALGMYILTKEYWGKLGGIISAVFYTYAPYHAVDLYVRGATNEFWAIAWFPLIYWSSYRLITDRKWKYVISLAFFYALLMLSHNPLLMIFTPTLIIWCLFWLINSTIKIKDLKNHQLILLVKSHLLNIIPKLVISAIFALTLAAFFTLPVLFEKQLAHVDSITMGYFNYLAHFVSFEQLFFSSFWDYGASVFGIEDGMSFQIGYLHWAVTLFSLITAFVINKKKPQLSLIIIIIFLITLFSAFMAHLRSSLFWRLIPALEFIQFPWRFLSLVIFGCSFLSGSLFLIFNRLFIKIILFVSLIIGVIALNYQYFDWDIKYPDMTDQEKFSGKNWEKQLTSSIFDYLPIAAPLPPVSAPKGNLEIIDGSGTFTTLVKNTIYQSYQLDLDQNSHVRLNTFYFPNWKYYLSNGQTQELTDYQLHPELGVPEFKLPAGQHLLEAKFYNTPIRSIGNSLSLIAWVILLIVFIKTVVNKTKK